ncbi:Spy/CpxP family protein refolding chaperone [Mesorhizobium sp.]|uniref:Spy/CpxP family protein refolding chaperone n=1 Tax=Mesorhizobium sp. TaxID=1871066 RepID=UPI003BAAC944
MRKRLIAPLVIACLAGSFVPQGALAASSYEKSVPSAAEIQKIQQRQSVLLDAHLASMKAGLKLNDDQAKNWPAFEAAIRDAAKARADRWLQARERMSNTAPPSTLDRISMMADHLEKNAAELRKVADAGKPLYDSLSDAQKQDFGPLMRKFKPKKQL